MDEIQAAFLNVKLKYIQNDIKGRRKTANYYLKSIENKKIILPKLINQKQHVWHLFVIRTKKRDELQKYLLDNGIQTLIHYPIPPHKQEAYKEFKKLSFPVTECIYDEILSLPLSAVMTIEELEMVVKVLNKY